MMIQHQGELGVQYLAQEQFNIEAALAWDWTTQPPMVDDCTSAFTEI